MDVLTDVLSAIRLERSHYLRWQLTAPWGIDVQELETAAFVMLDSGQCWLIMDEQEPLVVTAGDLLVFPRGTHHYIADSISTSTIEHGEILKMANPEGLVVNWGGGGTPTTFVCGMFHFEGGNDHPLFSMLPQVIHIKGSQGRANDSLDMTLKFMATEVGSDNPGAETIVGRMIDVLFVQAVRAWMENQPSNQKDWLTALADPLIGSALGLIHEDPGQSWTVVALAERVGMSRSAFAARFTELVGWPPLQYITKWRMQLATNWLKRSDISLREIAERVGYQSESPFHKAFKRQVGVSPGAYRRDLRHASHGQTLTTNY